MDNPGCLKTGPKGRLSRLLLRSRLNRLLTIRNRRGCPRRPYMGRRAGAHCCPWSADPCTNADRSPMYQPPALVFKRGGEIRVKGNRKGAKGQADGVTTCLTAATGRSAMSPKAALRAAGEDCSPAARASLISEQLLQHDPRTAALG
jgi:hypothetical protein